MVCRLPLGSFSNSWIVVVILGVMHFFNLLVLSKWRTNATQPAREHDEYRARFNRVRDAVPAE